MIKIVYTMEEGDKLRFNLASFPVAELGEALEFLAEICNGKLDPDAEVYTCGIGSSYHVDKINTTLNIRLGF